MEVGKQIILLNNSKSHTELTNLVESSTVTDLIEAAISRLEHSDDTFISYWDAVLIGTENLPESDNKRYKIVSAVLDSLNKVILTHKRTYDIISRLFLDLPKFSPASLTEFCEYCTDSMRCGDAKCVGWKDLFPVVLKLVNDFPKLIVNAIATTGAQFRQQCIQNLTTMKWPKDILTPIAMMFKEMPITKEERTKILGKFTESLQELEPTELPPLANQLFSLSTNMSLILMVLFSFEKYFHKFYYQKLFSGMETDSATDTDSIDPYPHSEKELREVEETILYYLSKSTQYCITEEQVVANCRALSPAPKCILTPFILNCLLSMCNANRDPSSTSVLATSPILLFIRSVIKNNELEKKMRIKSAWCRDTLDRHAIDLNKVFTVLIDQSKEGMDAVTPGIVGLAFVLLKTKENPALNAIGINFLETFVKKRFMFGQGIVKEMVNLMLVNQDCVQHVECLTRLSLTSTLTVSECIGPISHILENMLLIPGQNAIDMMMAISPLMKNSDTIRDLFIDVMRRALYDRDESTQRMGVHGFCIVLKLIRDNNSRRVHTSNSNSSQVTISGLSLASQIVQSNRMLKSRHFDMLTLEILGILKKCFNQTGQIKVTLYEGLSKAIELNFDKIVRERSENVFDIWDNLGHLVSLMGRLVVLARKNELHCEIDSITKVLENIMNKIDALTVEQLGLIERLNEKTGHIGVQYLNALEGIMGYALHSATKENNHLTKILKLYKHHASTLSQLVTANIVKKGKKGRNGDSTANTSSIMKPIQFNPENIWNLHTLERFLQLIYGDNIPFATSNQVNALCSNLEFARFIVSTASSKVEKLHKDPQYRQLKHSKAALSHLCQIARLVFEKCIKCLPEMIQRFDLTFVELSMELFYQCLLAGDTVFKRKFDEFLKSITSHECDNVSQSIKRITRVIQELIEEIVLNDNGNDKEMAYIANSFLQCLELLYSIYAENDPNSLTAFKWAHNISMKYDISNKNMNQIHKLLFNLRIQNDFGSYFDCIALQISKMLGQHEEVSLDCQFELKSITNDTVETCITYVCNCLRQQIEFVEYCITKVKGIHSKLKITGLSTDDKCVQSMKSTERKICSQLIHICNTATHLANSCIPLGNSMDQVKRLIIQLYVCLTNMTKYLIMRHSLQPMSCQSIQFDQLVRAAGRSLAHKVYCMIMYVEEKQKPEKVIRETKFLPKLVLRIETFNKYVIYLGKKTKCEVCTKQLHIGRVRYFRIKDLQDELDKTLQQSQAEVDEANLDIDEINDSLSESDVEESESSSATSSSSIKAAGNGLTKAKLLRNMEQINKKAKIEGKVKRVEKDGKEGPPSKRRKVKSKN